MNNTELHEIQQRALLATTEPWVVDLINNEWVVSCGEIDNFHNVAKVVKSQNAANNAKFIAHARLDIIKCIDEISKLRKIVDELSSRTSSC